MSQSLAAEDAGVRQPCFTKNAEEPTSFTPVHHEADWIFPGKILAWQTPFFALR
jgi:hypothetical protein